MGFHIPTIHIPTIATLTNVYCRPLRLMTSVVDSILQRMVCQHPMMTTDRNNSETQRWPSTKRPSRILFQTITWDTTYNEETLSGNPTKAPVVNQLIKDVMRHEVRSEGAPLQARREITVEEFHMIIRIVEEFDSFLESSS